MAPLAPGPGAGALAWRVKASLVAYVRGLADGEVLVDDGAFEDDSGFVFPARGEQDGVLRFAGCLTFEGHNGMMHVELSEPSLAPAGPAWRIEFADPDAPTVRLHFADVARLERDDDGALLGTGVTLAADGADLFFGPYEQGTPLDDLVVRPTS